MYDPLRDVTTHLFLATFLVATGGLKAIYAAWLANESDPLFKTQPTQRMRYFFLALGLLISFGPIAAILGTHGWSQFTAGVSKWQSIPIMGWVVAFSSWYGLLSPLVALLAAWSIYRNPAQMAKRVRGGWVATRDVRARLPHKKIYTVEKLRGSDGQLFKRFRTTDHTA